MNNTFLRKPCTEPEDFQSDRSVIQQCNSGTDLSENDDTYTSVSQVIGPPPSKENAIAPSTSRNRSRVPSAVRVKDLWLNKMPEKMKKPIEVRTGSSTVYWDDDDVREKRPIELNSWSLDLNSDGQLTVTGEQVFDEFRKKTNIRQAIVTRRISPLIVSDNHQIVYSLVNKMDDSSIPKNIAEHFKNGIPGNWIEVCKYWRALLDGEKISKIPKVEPIPVIKMPLSSSATFSNSSYQMNQPNTDSLKLLKKMSSTNIKNKYKRYAALYAHVIRKSRQKPKLSNTIIDNDTETECNIQFPEQNKSESSDTELFNCSNTLRMNFSTQDKLNIVSFNKNSSFPTSSRLKLKNPHNSTVNSRFQTDAKRLNDFTANKNTTTENDHELKQKLIVDKKLLNSSKKSPVITPDKLNTMSSFNQTSSRLKLKNHHYDDFENDTKTRNDLTTNKNRMTSRDVTLTSTENDKSNITRMELKHKIVDKKLPNSSKKTPVKHALKTSATDLFGISIDTSLLNITVSSRGRIRYPTQHWMIDTLSENSNNRTGDFSTENHLTTPKSRNNTVKNKSSSKQKIDNNQQEMIIQNGNFSVIDHHSVKNQSIISNKNHKPIIIESGNLSDTSFKNKCSPKIRIQNKSISMNTTKSTQAAIIIENEHRSDTDNNHSSSFKNTFSLNNTVEIKSISEINLTSMKMSKENLINQKINTEYKKSLHEQINSDENTIKSPELFSKSEKRPTIRKEISIIIETGKDDSNDSDVLKKCTPQMNKSKCENNINSLSSMDRNKSNLSAFKIISHENNKTIKKSCASRKEICSEDESLYEALDNTNKSIDFRNDSTFTPKQIDLNDYSPVIIKTLDDEFLELKNKQIDTSIIENIRRDFSENTDSSHTLLITPIKLNLTNSSVKLNNIQKMPISNSSNGKKGENKLASKLSISRKLTKIRNLSQTLFHSAASETTTFNSSRYRNKYVVVNSSDSDLDSTNNKSSNPVDKIQLKNCFINLTKYDFYDRRVIQSCIRKDNTERKINYTKKLLDVSKEDSSSEFVAESRAPRRRSKRSRPVQQLRHSRGKENVDISSANDSKIDENPRRKQIRLSKSPQRSTKRRQQSPEDNFATTVQNIPRCNNFKNIGNEKLSEKENYTRRNSKRRQSNTTSSLLQQNGSVNNVSGMKEVIVLLTRLPQNLHLNNTVHFEADKLRSLPKKSKKRHSVLGEILVNNEQHIGKVVDNGPKNTPIVTRNSRSNSKRRQSVFDENLINNKITVVSTTSPELQTKIAEPEYSQIVTRNSRSNSKRRQSVLDENLINNKKIVELQTKIAEPENSQNVTRNSRSNSKRRQSVLVENLINNKKTVVSTTSPELQTKIAEPEYSQIVTRNSRSNSKRRQSVLDENLINNKKTVVSTSPELQTKITEPENSQIVTRNSRSNSKRRQSVLDENLINNKKTVVSTSPELQTKIAEPENSQTVTRNSRSNSKRRQSVLEENLINNKEKIFKSPGRKLLDNESNYTPVVVSQSCSSSNPQLIAENNLTQSENNASISEDVELRRPRSQILSIPEKRTSCIELPANITSVSSRGRPRIKRLPYWKANRLINCEDVSMLEASTINDTTLDCTKLISSKQKNAIVAVPKPVENTKVPNNISVDFDFSSKKTKIKEKTSKTNQLNFTNQPKKVIKRPRKQKPFFPDKQDSLTLYNLVSKKKRNNVSKSQEITQFPESTSSLSLLSDSIVRKRRKLFMKDNFLEAELAPPDEVPKNLALNFKSDDDYHTDDWSEISAFVH